MDNVMSENENFNTNQGSVEQTAKPQERTFRQSDLNDIVGRAKHEAVESYKRQNANVSHQSGMSEDEVRRLTSEEVSRQRDKWQAEQQEAANAATVQRIVSAYQSKIAGINEKYSDYNEVSEGLNMGVYPNVVQMLAENVDNADDVLYELSKNRSKLNQLQSTYERSPKDAVYDLQRLAKSIKENTKVMSSKQAATPLSQQRPSSPGTGSPASSMSALKSKYRG